ncbi:signal peptidase II [Falsarthrobacter nasiphocae]|uniref:Lipoprotein signal peptidase n=1 Tax=Falsarthrobacter nasiphocae TaxID=189863 RepID=A0AAE4C6B1_9MICC|nr:signal peptidase II [Falsarthrobacter nasiphocae]MDR6891309.1 signal peptidase II [Falsarthrobacter nasiphocae]
MPSHANHPDSPPASTARGARLNERRSLALITLVPLVLVLAADQIVKRIVETHMTVGQRIDVIGSFVQWHFIKNPGAAFSLGANSTVIATVLAAAVTVIVAVVAVRSRVRAWSLAAGLILGGALGNLWDRLFREPGFAEGHVVDFIGVGTFPRFNIADSAVSVGVALAVLLLLRGIDPWPSRGGDAADRTPSMPSARHAAPTATEESR